MVVTETSSGTVLPGGVSISYQTAEVTVTVTCASGTALVHTGYPGWGDCTSHRQRWTRLLRGWQGWLPPLVPMLLHLALKHWHHVLFSVKPGQASLSSLCTTWETHHGDCSRCKACQLTPRIILHMSMGNVMPSQGRAKQIGAAVWLKQVEDYRTQG